MKITSVATYFEYEKLNQFLLVPTVLMTLTKHWQQSMGLSTYRKWHSRLSIFWVCFNELLVAPFFFVYILGSVPFNAATLIYVLGNRAAVFVKYLSSGTFHLPTVNACHL